MFGISKACVAALLLAQADAHKLVTSNSLLRGGKESGNQHEKIVLKDGSDWDRNMLPMTKEKFALVAHAIDRNNAIYWEPVPEGVTIHDYHNSLDRMYTEEWGDNICMVTWMGTNTTDGDWDQNLNTAAKPIGDGDCVVQEGLYQAYSGSGNGDSREFLPDLEAFVTSCSDKGKQLVLTGHSQGGGSAGIASLLLAEYNPITILFGNAQWIQDGLEDCAPDPNTIWRFINSENADRGIVYDPVPNLAGVPILGLIAEGFSAGGYIVLPPGGDQGDVVPMTSSVTVYGPENPEMDIGIQNIDVADGSGFRTGSAHQSPNYKRKIHDLLDQIPDGGVLDTSGFIDGSMCHASDLCHSASACEAESYFSSVARCNPKLEFDEPCNEDSDCLSGNCGGWNPFNLRCRN
mmetsp:Transcript_23485/g.42421  ORF Transcript_23485/g.42421 Transcript_23485/m.42421 type:complete len:404 (+) Transcript_23485:89-1300(+)|eukprot:CAMPEP_0196142688 /NCGR_PEP_ID=MMETSP0910-20130528/12100_1 /TAXON_ID=49265 /ORGANISM="Thalassiosira rotula, Strain GSO102" /LENGTH=403 /DNA_ID=CAMNT_0041404039 /DNA_START=85 /DNA_END=1296 /DNA_ORIENTATION=+